MNIVAVGLYLAAYVLMMVRYEYTDMGLVVFGLAKLMVDQPRNFIHALYHCQCLSLALYLLFVLFGAPLTFAPLVSWFSFFTFQNCFFILPILQNGLFRYKLIFSQPFPSFLPYPKAKDLSYPTERPFRIAMWAGLGAVVGSSFLLLDQRVTWNDFPKTLFAGQMIALVVYEGLEKSFPLLLQVARNIAD